MPGRGGGSGVFDRAAALLAATTRVAVATGVVSIWDHTPAEAAAAHDRLRRAYPGRFLLGLGISHAPIVDAQGPARYRTPVKLTRDYLDALDAEDPPVPKEERALAALGPRMLELARDTTAGSHPYLVPPEHTSFARSVLGPGSLLAPEQSAVLSEDPAAARALARKHLTTPYTKLPNYVNNWLRSGFTEDDVRDPCSDRLVDGVVAWGGPAAIAERVRAHHDAGADHVCVQVLAEDRNLLQQQAWRTLAEALLPG
jgi:probable F420-dependent oxidoreductase